MKIVTIDFDLSIGENCLRTPEDASGHMVVSIMHDGTWTEAKLESIIITEWNGEQTDPKTTLSSIAEEAAKRLLSHENSRKRYLRKVARVSDFPK